MWKCFPIQLYIFWLLHQTTTFTVFLIILFCCISFDSYIKPQLICKRYEVVKVVYLLTPTSNHNLSTLHFSDVTLYIFWLLHQTTTHILHTSESECCISFDSYIKPQHGPWHRWKPYVVYLLTPTSNHNQDFVIPSKIEVVYLLTPTSNHNHSITLFSITLLYIFWLLHQTTTWRRPASMKRQLYIFWLLHQTTTWLPSAPSSRCCISFDSYIKPQP